MCKILVQLEHAKKYKFHRNYILTDMYNEAINTFNNKY